MDQFSPGCRGKAGSFGGDGTEHQSAGGAEEERRRKSQKGHFNLKVAAQRECEMSLMLEMIQVEPL